MELGVENWLLLMLIDEADEEEEDDEDDDDEDEDEFGGDEAVGICLEEGFLASVSTRE